MVRRTREKLTFAQRLTQTRISTATEALKYAAVIDQRIILIPSGRDVTDLKITEIQGFRYRPRALAFLILHNRWPRGHFLLPWE